MTSEALRRTELLDDRHDLEELNCGVPALDQWLRRSARTASGAGTAATYVLHRGPRLVGYFALAMSSLGHQQAPTRLRRGMPDPVPVILLARLALDRSEHGRGLGGHLLVDALRRCVRGGHELGARAVLVDAATEQAAGFYRHFGFRDLEDRRLRRRLSDIERALGSS